MGVMNIINVRFQIKIFSYAQSFNFFGFCVFGYKKVIGFVLKTLWIPPIPVLENLLVLAVITVTVQLLAKMVMTVIVTIIGQDKIALSIIIAIQILVWQTGNVWMRETTSYVNVFHLIAVSSVRKILANRILAELENAQLTNRPVKAFVIVRRLQLLAQIANTRIAEP